MFGDKQMLKDTVLLACKQILKDDVKREQYDYAVAHPDQVR
jgi:hypothetical protein